MANNVFVYCEIEGTTVQEVSQELLTKGRKLANQLNVELHAVVIGTGIKNKVEDQILPYGVDKLFVFDGEGLFPYTSAPHTDIIVNLFKMVRESTNDVIINGASMSCNGYCDIDRFDLLETICLIISTVFVHKNMDFPGKNKKSGPDSLLNGVHCILRRVCVNHVVFVFGRFGGFFAVRDKANDDQRDANYCGNDNFCRHFQSPSSAISCLQPSSEYIGCVPSIYCRSSSGVSKPYHSRHSNTLAGCLDLLYFTHLY